MDYPEQQDIEDFAAIHGGKQLETILKILGKGAVFIEALETSVGRELLGGMVDELNELAEEILDNPNCPAAKKIKFKVLRDISRNWAAKIMSYHKANKRLLTIRERKDEERRA